MMRLAHKEVLTVFLSEPLHNISHPVLFSTVGATCIATVLFLRECRWCRNEGGEARPQTEELPSTRPIKLSNYDPFKDVDAGTEKR